MDRSLVAAAPRHRLGARPFGRFLLPAAVLAALAAVAAPARAQYFGQNKVHYQDFDFRVLRTDHFDIYFYPDEEAAARQAGRLAERWYARYEELLSHHLSGRQPLILYASHPDFEQTNAIPGELGEGTGGVTEILKRRIVLPAGASLEETNHVIGHELVHAFQYDITGQGQGTGFRVPTAARLPLWFIEGQAEYLSLGPVDPNTAMWLRDAFIHDQLPRIRDLDDPKYFPYRYGQAFWAFLAGHWGDKAVGEALKAAGRNGRADQALQKVTGLSTDSLSAMWHRDIAAAYGAAPPAGGAAPGAAPAPAPASGRLANADLLIGGERHPGLNVAPALSPDGDRLAFFSARDLFSVDLYVADAHTGRIERHVLHTATDPHFQSLGFIASAGAWDPAGRRLAFGAVSGGQAVLSVLDMTTGRETREITVPGVGQIFSPTWSPDGRSVAFSAQNGGFTDLFVVDLDGGAVRRLTDDAFADLEPAWSPDGRSLVFATDRFTSNLNDLMPGPLHLALLDVATGAIRELPGFPGAKQIDPHWSPDGSAVFFVSDRGGVSNVYRLALASGTFTQVTDVVTGVSGITPESPALSVASATGRLAFSTYEASGYRLYAMDSSAVRAAARPVSVPGSPVEETAAVLPPTRRASSQLVGLLRSPGGLPPDTALPVAPYRAGLSLDYIAPPTVGVGVSSYGSYVAGGIGAQFSDMLGNRQLTMIGQINGGVKDIAALVAYENDRARWNWGVQADQIPYRTGGYGSAAGTFGGDPTLFEQVQVFRQTNRDLSAFAAYPFNQVRRVELSAGISSISFDNQVESAATSLTTGQVYYDTTASLPAGSALTLFNTSAALVYDNSFFGATSPVLGQRYRLAVAPTVGSIDFVGVVADWRRYVMPVRPFTIALRAMHVARYGPGGEDSRVLPLFLGYPTLVRGYDIGSFTASECPSTANACPVFDRLLGSRMLVGNAEVRFPLLGLLHIGGGYYGAFPIEAGVFADGGVAWYRNDETSLAAVRNRAVSSVGAVVRINLLGFAVAEVDWVHPFDRPMKGSYLELSLSPGF